MQELLRSLSNRLYQPNSLIADWRTQRLQRFLSLVRPPQGAKILDLGGTPFNWQLLNQTMEKHDFQITLVNLPGTFDPQGDGCGFTLVEANAADLRHHFGDRSFDVVFSNSVIEHVGDELQQAAFAQEVQRLASAYWVQTPSNQFPLEVHTGIPFYWQLPNGVRDRLLQTWRDRLPDWAEMIAQTRVIARRRMMELFPTALFYTEYKLGFEKSYTAYSPFDTA